MQLLASPIVWIVLFLVYSMNKNSKPKGTNLDIFNNPAVDPKGGSSVESTNGTIVTGVTINTAKAKSIASAVWEELNDVFTDELKVIACLKGINSADFILVYDQFGKKDRSFLGAEGGYFGSQNDLIEWINFEVTDEKNKNKLNKQFPTIF